MSSLILIPKNPREAAVAVVLTIPTLFPIFVNCQIPGLTSTTGMTFQTSTTGVAFQTTTTGMTLQTSTTGMAFQTTTTGMALQTSTTGMTFQPSTTGMTFQTSTTGMTFQTSTTGVAFQTTTTGMTLQTSTTGMAFQTSTTGMAFQTTTTGMALQTSTTGMTFQPSTTGMTFQTSTTGMTLQTSTITGMTSAITTTAVAPTTTTAVTPSTAVAGTTTAAPTTTSAATTTLSTVTLINAYGAYIYLSGITPAQVSSTTAQFKDTLVTNINAYCNMDQASARMCCNDIKNYSPSGQAYTTSADISATSTHWAGSVYFTVYVTFNPANALCSSGTGSSGTGFPSGYVDKTSITAILFSRMSTIGTGYSTSANAALSTSLAVSVVSVAAVGSSSARPVVSGWIVTLAVVVTSLFVFGMNWTPVEMCVDKTEEDRLVTEGWQDTFGGTGPKMETDVNHNQARPFIFV